jgi:hypothetical protein
MPDTVLAEQTGAMRVAVAALHNSGGCIATLRMPGLAASGDPTEELGLATPQFQDLSLGPVAFSKANSSAKLTVSAATMLTLTQSFAFDSVAVLFAAAAGIVIDDELYFIHDIISASANGNPYSYTLMLEHRVR